MTPETPKRQRDEEGVSRRDFLAGAAAFGVAGLSPEEAEAAMSPKEFADFLESVEGIEDHKEEIIKHYSDSSESLRYLLQQNFKKCEMSGERPYIREFNSVHNFDVGCK